MDLFKDLTKEEIKCFERHYTRCEFDDECGACGKPEHGSYATGYDEYTGEVDDYICGKCAVAGIGERLDADKKEYEGLEDYINNQESTIFDEP